MFVYVFVVCIVVCFICLYLLCYVFDIALSVLMCLMCWFYHCVFVSMCFHMCLLSGFIWFNCFRSYVFISFLISYVLLCYVYVVVRVLCVSMYVYLFVFVLVCFIYVVYPSLCVCTSLNLIFICAR